MPYSPREIVSGSLGLNPHVERHGSTNSSSGNKYAEPRHLHLPPPRARVEARGGAVRDGGWRIAVYGMDEGVALQQSYQA
jgi:hypothetical protein